MCGKRRITKYIFFWNLKKIGEIIVNAAKKLEADQIVMGSRGLGGIQQFLVGSVSKYVVEHAHCPVLVIKH